jgi:branched-chain amino acid transport system ATP-binding protein
MDEPLAGMGPEDAHRTIEMLRTLRGQVTIVLIEHDINAVFALADRISVLVYGKVIACGRPDVIRDDPAVQQAYLGEGDEFDA